MKLTHFYRGVSLLFLIPSVVYFVMGSFLAWYGIVIGFILDGLAYAESIKDNEVLYNKWKKRQSEWLQELDDIHYDPNHPSSIRYEP